MPNKFAWWLRRIVGSKQQRPAKRASFVPRPEGSCRRPARAGFRPCVETLECRLVPALPTVTNPTMSAITPYTAILGGDVTSDGGSPLNFRGVVYSLTSVNPNPTRGGPGVAEVDLPGPPVPGVFTTNVTPLTPNSGYSFRAFASNAEGTAYSAAVATNFATPPPNLMMPADTVVPDKQDPNKVLNTVLYLGPTENDNNPIHQKIPSKTITFTNNTNSPVFPILVDTNATIDDLNKSQALYDPIDPLYNEYRGYVGYKNAGGSFVGLLPGTAITVDVPLVFWDGARIFIGTDPTYLDMINNAPQVGQTPTIPNPFQYYAKNTDGSLTKHVVLDSGQVSGAPAGTTGVVMWYRQGLDLKDPKQPIGPANDSPAQLAEFTMRDPVLSKINPNIDKLKPKFGETHALINYDVSYVDNMTLPVAMEALDVPIPVTEPPLHVQTPFPGPRLPYGWVGSAQTVDQFHNSAADFLKTNPDDNTNLNGLGTYFNDAGWTQYNFTVDNSGSPAFPTPPLTKIPSAQDALADSPLGDVSSNYEVHANAYMLTSGGIGPKQVLGAGSSFSDGSDKLYIVANTPALQNILKTELQKGMVVAVSGSGAPNVPAGTIVQTIGPGDGGFTFTEYTPPGGGATTVLEVGLSNTIASSGDKSFAYTFTRPVSDYLSNTLVNLWYTWANYYVTHLPSGAQDQSDLPGHAVPDPTDQGAVNNVIKLDSPNTHLVAGMAVTGAGISTNPADGKTTIVSVEADNRTIHLSQGVTPGATGTYSFALPSMSALPGSGDSIVKLLTPFTPVATPSVPNVLQFAQNAYQLLSFMGQVPANTSATAPPVSVQVTHNVIGGNVTKPTNLDAFHKIEVAYRTMVKSLLRGVNDFTLQTDQGLWYPDPSKPVANTGQKFNIYNLDPFVWFVHQKLGLSGYGFSLDDDAADIGANYATKLAISIGGLNGLPNQVEYSETAPFGPVSGNATVLSLGADTLKPPSITFPYEISGLPKFVWYSVKSLDTQNTVPGAQVKGAGVTDGTFLVSGADAAQTKFSFALGPVVSDPAYSDGSAKLFVVANTPLLQGIWKAILQKGMVVTVSGSGAPNVPAGTTVQSIGPADNPGFNFTQYTPPGGAATTVLEVGLSNPITSSGGNSFTYTFTLPTPPLTSPVGSTTQYTLYYGGTPNTSPLTLGPGETDAVSPYTNTSTVAIPVGDTLKIVTRVGNLTSYTQQAQQFTRVKGETTPVVNTVIDGTLQAGRVDVVDGTLAGSGTILGGAVDVMGPVSGYSYVDSLGQKVTIEATKGGFLQPGDPGGTPGKLTVGSTTSPGDVTMYGASFTVSARGATTAGADYGQLFSYGKVSLGSSKLGLTLLSGYTPKAGDTLTIISAQGGVTGRFSQGTSIIVGGFRFTIGYNPNSVVLTFVPQPLQHPAPQSITPSVSAAFSPSSGKVVEVVNSAGVLVQYDDAGAHRLMGGVRSAGVAFDRSGRELLLVTFQNGTLELFYHHRAHLLGKGVLSASIAFGPFGPVLEVVNTQGFLTQFGPFGAHRLGAGVLSASVAFGPSGEVLEVVNTNHELLQFDASGRHVRFARGVLSAGVAIGPVGILDVIFQDHTLRQFTLFGGHPLG